jgi:predicted permease
MDILGEIARTVRHLRAAVTRARLDAELAEEIQQHIALRTQALIDAGADPREAAWEARRAFGNITIVREESRQMWGFRSFDALLQDLRFGGRLLRRSPGFTLAAVGSLAIGIGAAAAVFSLADSLLLRTLPVRSPQELVLFRWISGPELVFDSLNGYGNQTETESSSTSFSLTAFETIRQELASRAEVFAFADLYRTNISIDGRPDTAYAHAVSGNYFSALGLTPSAGRLLGPGDEREDAPAAAVLSHEFWERRFGGDENAIGKLVVLNGVSFTIAGVLPRDFRGTLQVGQSLDLMVPLSVYGSVTRGGKADDPNFWWVLMMARPAPGVSPETLQSASDAILKRTVMAAKPDLAAGMLPRMRIEAGGQGQVENRDLMREPLKIMAMVVAIVLLVACANVANLLLARGRARAREMAVRAAIGAPRGRMVRQLLTEGLLLGGIACLAGLVLAQWLAMTLLPALGSDPMPLSLTYRLDWRILGFTCSLALICSLAFGLGPSVRATDARMQATLQEGSRGTAGAQRRFGASAVLVVAQVALSMLLVTAAALLTWSAIKAQSVPAGFDPQRLLTFSVDTSLNGYDEIRTRGFIVQALERLRAIPGVTAASISSHRLISNSASIATARPAGPLPAFADPAEARQFAMRNRAWRLTIDDRFHQTLGIPILRGTTFPTTMAPDGPGKVMVNAALAQQLFGSADVVGRHLVMGTRAEGKPLEIVGVVADARYTTLKSDPPPTVYIPYQQASLNRVTFNVRTAGEPTALTSTVRETLRGIDDTLPLFDIRTQEEQILRSLTQERLFARLALLLGSVTLVLSAIGVYGLLAYAVTRRTPEIGVRMALGAERSQVRWMILRQSVLLVGIGLLIGIPAAIATSGTIQSLLFGLEATDPRAVAASAVILAAVALAAAAVPARRASRIDPLVALRSE